MIFHTVKKVLAYPMYCFNKIENVFNKNIKSDILILMYHRIINKSESETYLQDGMYVDPNTFRRHIQYLKSNFTVVSLDSIPSIMSLEFKPLNNKPFCVLTFDDGWNDFYENAYPILKSFNICATVFLPTDFIGTNKMFWTDRIANILYIIEQGRGNCGIIHNSSNYIIDKIVNMKGTMDEKIENAVEILKLLRIDEIDRILKELADKWEVDSEIKLKSFLSWGEIREMHQSEIIYFGSHTKSHKILTTIPENEIRDELIQSKNKLIDENVVKSSFIPFAYPNGNYTDKIADMVEEAGYSIALTTKKGWNRVTDKKTSCYQLKRVGIHQDMTSTDAMFACRIYGIY